MDKSSMKTFVIVLASGEPIQEQAHRIIVDDGVLQGIHENQESGEFRLGWAYGVGGWKSVHAT